MDKLNPSILEIAAAKLEFRKRRATLSFPEKIRILVELQKRYAPIIERRGGKLRIWKLDEPRQDLSRIKLQ